MSHGIGVTAAFRDAPDAVVGVFALITQLGDVWFYLTVLAVAYGFAGTLPLVGRVLTRERVGFVIAVALGVLAVTVGLKGLFAHSRPPGAATVRELAWLPGALAPVWESIATGDGFGLPSGHATASTVIYGAAALALEVGRRRTRYGAAALVVALVAVSRVVIGVHYLGDVLAGLLAGGVYLAVVWWSTRGEHVERAFSIALVAGLAGVVAHFDVETAAALGGALGGRLTWGIVGGRLPKAVTRREGALATLLGLTTGGVLVGAATAVETAVVGFVATGLAVAAILAAPLVVRRVSG